MLERTSSAVNGTWADLALQKSNLYCTLEKASLTYTNEIDGHFRQGTSPQPSAAFPLNLAAGPNSSSMRSS